jgi:DNA-directed RNA polymerase subunit N (RpoN/RPB10)
MIIPVRCTNCGRVLGNLYTYYNNKVNEQKIKKKIPLDKTIYFSEDNITKTIEGNILDELELYGQCCRTIMLTHVDQK